MLYRFSIELSDVDRGLYQTIDFRIAQHPSEIGLYLLTRVLAYVLSFEDGLEFSGAGLSDPETPAMKVVGPNGGVDVWIEIGNPSAKKLHKATKTSKRVIVYTYKNGDVLVDDIQKNSVHKSEELEIYSLDAKFLTQLEPHLEKNNRWQVLHQQGVLDINTGKESFVTDVRRFMVKK